MMMRELRNVIVLTFYQFQVLITEKWEARKSLKLKGWSLAVAHWLL